MCQKIDIHIDIQNPVCISILVLSGGITMQRREKGTGTIFQRDSGTWSGRVSIGRGGNGKIKYKYFSGKTEAEVKRKIREYNKSGRPQNPQQILLKDYLMSWLTNVKKISLKPSSFDRLESTALKQVIPRLGDFKISEITPEDIGKMLTEIQANVLRPAQACPYQNDL